MTKGQFPKTLFVKVEEDGGMEWFVADDEAVSLAEVGEKVRVARYELVDTSSLELVASWSAHSKQK